MFKKFIVILCLFPLLGVAQAADFQAGKAYQVLAGKKAPESGKVSVLEFFSYGCHYCYQLEPSLAAWAEKKGDDIDFARIPVSFQPGWDVYAKAYYTAKALQLTKTLSPALFKAIQEERTPLKKSAQMQAFLIKHGADAGVVKSAFESSPTIDAMLKQGTILMQDYQVTAVPSLIVGNQYKTDLVMADGKPEQLMEILNFLIKKSATKK